MCYMSGRRTVGVRELRQNLSVYLRRVGRGESLEVTERGRAVALLTPLPERSSWRDRLTTEGKLIPARGKLADLGPPLPVHVRGSISTALAAEREDRRL
jgi:prevent-host-death family protein